MNRIGKLRRQIPGAPPGLLAELAAKPAAEVELIVEALKQARLDERAAQREKRAARRAERKKANKAEDEKIADAAGILVHSVASRAAVNIDLLPQLQRVQQEASKGLASAVTGLRRAGYSDAAIGRALGRRGDAVARSYGPRGTGPEPPGG